MFHSTGLNLPMSIIINAHLFNPILCNWFQYTRPNKAILTFVDSICLFLFFIRVRRTQFVHIFQFSLFSYIHQRPWLFFNPFLLLFLFRGYIYWQSRCELWACHSIAFIDIIMLSYSTNAVFLYLISNLFVFNIFFSLHLNKEREIYRKTEENGGFPGFSSFLPFFRVSPEECLL